MKRKGLAVLIAGIMMSISVPVLSYASHWDRQEDGSYKLWDTEENLDENSGFYHIRYLQWVPQEDGTWKLYWKQDKWVATCGHLLGHSVDPKLTCPGELRHSEHWITGRVIVDGTLYYFNEDGIMQANAWIPIAKNYQTFSSESDQSTYKSAIYRYYDESGAECSEGVIDGRVIGKDGLWMDPSVIPCREDGRIDITKINWTQDIPTELERRIAEEFTPDEITEEFRKLPEYLGETVNSYGIVELKFSNSEIETNYKTMYSFKAVMKANGY